MKRNKTAMYAAAFASFSANTALVTVIPMLEASMPKRDMSQSDLRPILSARQAPAIETKKFQICIPPLIPVCLLVPVTFNEVSRGLK